MPFPSLRTRFIYNDTYRPLASRDDVSVVMDGKCAQNDTQLQNDSINVGSDDSCDQSKKKKRIDSAVESCKSGSNGAYRPCGDVTGKEGDAEKKVEEESVHGQEAQRQEEKRKRDKVKGWMKRRMEEIGTGMAVGVMGAGMGVGVGVGAAADVGMMYWC